MNLEHEIRRNGYVYLFEYDPFDDVSAFYSTIEEENFIALPEHKGLDYFESWCEKKGLLGKVERTRDGFDSFSEKIGTADFSEVFREFAPEFERYCDEWVDYFETNVLKIQ
jgi:hypothetical protein